MLRLKRTLAAIFLAAVLAAVLVSQAVPLSAASSGLTTGDTPSLEPYKVGALFALTGVNASLGLPQEQTVQMIMDQVNSAGGIDGHPLEVIVYDTESDSARCATLAVKLIEEDGVLAIVGPSTTGESMVLKGTVEDAGVPLVSCASHESIVAPPDNTWVFKTAPGSEPPVRCLFRYLAQNKVSTIGIITETSGYGNDGRTKLQSLAPLFGINIVADETYAPNAVDVTTQLSTIQGSGAEAIVCWASIGGSTLVARDRASLAITLPLCCSPWTADPSFVVQAGSAAEGVILPSGKVVVAEQLPPWDPQRAVVNQYRLDFEALYGPATVSTFGGHAYDALTLLIAALGAVGPDPALIRDYLENSVSKVPGVSGIFRMSPADHCGLLLDAFAMVQVVLADYVYLAQQGPDISRDRKVDFKDLAILGAHYGETTSVPYPPWDINVDGRVDFKDLAILGANYGVTY